MTAKLGAALKYPFNLKPLFILGALFGILLIGYIVSIFVLGPAMGAGDTSQETFTPLLIIAFLFFMALFFIFSILFYGYLVRVSRSIIAGDLVRAPDLTDIRGLFVDGLKFIVICLVYAIPPLVVMMLAVFLLGEWGIISIFPLIPLFYVYPLAAAHLAKTNSLSKALNIVYIYSMIFRNLKGFTLSLIFCFIVSFILTIAALLIVTYPFVIIAVNVAIQYIFTIFYMESTGLIE